MHGRPFDNLSLARQSSPAAGRHFCFSFARICAVENIKNASIGANKKEN